MEVTPVQAERAQLMGVPQGMDFAPGGLVSDVLVTVKRGWVNSDQFSLYINITGLNGGVSLHGEDIIPLSETTVFGADKDIAEVVVPWTKDETPQQADEIYTTCVQVLFNDRPFGSEKCTDFGPF